MSVEPVTRSFGSAGVAMVTLFTRTGELDRDATRRPVGTVIGTHGTAHTVELSLGRISSGALPAVMAKAALKLMGVLPTRTVRLPQVAATNEEVTLLRSDLEEAQLL